MHSLAVYVKGGSPFVWDSGDSYLSFQLALLQSVSCFCFLCQSFLIIFMHSFWFISSNIGEHSMERCISPHFFFISPSRYPPFFGNIHPPLDTHHRKKINIKSWKPITYRNCVLSTEFGLIDIIVAISIAVDTACNVPYGEVGTKSHHIKTIDWP